MIWGFTYRLKKPLHCKEPYGGTTEVTDGLGHRKEYTFSEEQRLTSVDHFLDNNLLYRKERMIWEDEGENKICLLAHGLTDNEDNLVMRRDYDYDIKGNVLKETLRGNLTGCQCELVNWNSFEEAEVYSINYTYNPTGLLTYEDDGRKKTVYKYLPGTNLLTFKLVYNSQEICERHHYEYDSNSVLIKEIYDDGNSSDIDNLSAVTERRKKNNSNNSTANRPCRGGRRLLLMPSTNEESLISRLEDLSPRFRCQRRACKTN